MSNYQEDNLPIERTRERDDDNKHGTYTQVNNDFITALELLRRQQNEAKLDLSRTYARYGVQEPIDRSPRRCRTSTTGMRSHTQQYIDPFPRLSSVRVTNGSQPTTMMSQTNSTPLLPLRSGFVEPVIPHRLTVSVDEEETTQPAPSDPDPDTDSEYEVESGDLEIGPEEDAPEETVNSDSKEPIVSDDLKHPVPPSTLETVTSLSLLATQSTNSQVPAPQATGSPDNANAQSNPISVVRAVSSDSKHPPAPPHDSDPDSEDSDDSRREWASPITTVRPLFTTSGYERLRAKLEVAYSHQRDILNAVEEKKKGLCGYTLPETLTGLRVVLSQLRLLLDGVDAGYQGANVSGDGLRSAMKTSLARLAGNRFMIKKMLRNIIGLFSTSLFNSICYPDNLVDLAAPDDIKCAGCIDDLQLLSNRLLPAVTSFTTVSNQVAESVVATEEAKRPVNLLESKHDSGHDIDYERVIGFLGAIYCSYQGIINNTMETKTGRDGFDFKDTLHGLNGLTTTATELHALVVRHLTLSANYQDSAGLLRQMIMQLRNLCFSPFMTQYDKQGLIRTFQATFFRNNELNDMIPLCSSYALRSRTALLAKST